MEALSAGPFFQTVPITGITNMEVYTLILFIYSHMLNLPVQRDYLCCD